MILRPMLVGLAGRQGSRPDGRRELSVMRRCRSKNGQISSGVLMSWFLGPAIREALFNRVSSYCWLPCDPLPCSP